MSSTPRYGDTKKGKALDAISKSHDRTWNEIQEITGFNEKELRSALKELFDDELISKSGDSYWIARAPACNVNSGIG